MLGTAAEYIALAFFIVRISLAAAIAAGEASLSGSGCCAPARTTVRANPSATLAADKSRENRFIPILLGLRCEPRATKPLLATPARTAILTNPKDTRCSP